jgi:hypothetical protein
MASKANIEIPAIALASGLGSTTPVFSDNEVLLLLRAAVKREGSPAAFAKRYDLDFDWRKTSRQHYCNGSWTSQSVRRRLNAGRL